MSEIHLDGEFTSLVASEPGSIFSQTSSSLQEYNVIKL
jgi:hypothetical protein